MSAKTPTTDRRHNILVRRLPPKKRQHAPTFVSCSCSVVTGKGSEETIRFDSKATTTIQTTTTTTTTSNRRPCDRERRRKEGKKKEIRKEKTGPQKAHKTDSQRLSTVRKVSVGNEKTDFLRFPFTINQPQRERERERERERRATHTQRERRNPIRPVCDCHLHRCC